jgi:hypothetical protein
MRELWSWVKAGAAYDYGDPLPLAKLIQDEPVPPEFQQMVSDIVAGVRQLPRKGKANQKVPPVNRLEAAAAVSLFQGLADIFRRDAVEIGDEKGVEPIDVIASANETAKEGYRIVMEETGVSERTVKTMLADLKRRIESWPDV